MEPWSVVIDGGVTDVEWPASLDMGKEVYAFLASLKEFGLKPSLTTNATKGEMRIGVQGAVAVYRKGYRWNQEPPSVMTFQGEQVISVGVDATFCWLLEESHGQVGQVMPVTDDITASPTVPYEDYASLANEMSRYIPDIRKMVKCPCSCARGDETIWTVIQHLNDSHHPTESMNLDMWSRERIADWLDEVDADLTFDPDLPKKRAEERKALREKTTDQHEAGMKAVEAIKADLKFVEDAAEEASKATWKVSAAIQEYAAHLKNVMAKIAAVPSPSAVNEEAVPEMVEKTFAAPGCECTICSQDSHEEES